MTSQLSTIICVIFGVVSWYYFNKFMESEREYSRLHKSYDELHIENKKMKSRVKDLQSYKNDVSKTFKILDNELLLINDHLKRNSDQNIQEARTNFPITSSIPIGRIPLARVASFTALPQNNNISLLTPELLTSLFNMNTEDFNNQIPNHQVPNHQIPNHQVHDQQVPNQQQVPNHQIHDQQVPNQQQVPDQQTYDQQVHDEQVYYQQTHDQQVPNQRVNDLCAQSSHDTYFEANNNTVQQIMYDMSCNEYDQFLINNN